MTAVGQPLTRLDGRLKVTGGAQYAGDIPLSGTVHGAIVHSTIANGRVTSIKTAPAEGAPGVLAVLTSKNMPRFNPTPKPWSHLHPHGQGYLPMQDDVIYYNGQPVAVVVAETLDQAAYAGTLVEVSYEAKAPSVFGPDSEKDAVDPPQFLWPVNSSVGDAGKAIAGSEVKIQGTYWIPDRHHMQMEPHTTLAAWDDQGVLTLFDATQHISGTRELFSIVLGMPAEKIEVVSRFVGGGFGGKAYVWPHQLLAAAAAKHVHRPVKIQLTRAQMFSMVGHQSAIIQTISLGADKQGKLKGIKHDSISATPLFDSYIEYAANCTRSLWAASGGIATGHKVVHVNRNTPTAMRPPHEALGHVALEGAMDELAYATGVDPVQLRLLNDTQVDPLTGRPFSTRAMRECLLQGAERFGWSRRTQEPRSMRDGKYLIGQGVASAIYTHWKWPGTAKVVLRADGSAVVLTGAHDLGTGTYTVMRQVAADALGVRAEKVDVQLGSTRLPPTNPAIGSATMANTGSAVFLAGQAARDQAIKLAVSGRNAPFAGASTADITAENGELIWSNQGRRISYAQLLKQHGMQELTGSGNYDPVWEHLGPKAIFSYSAVFAEVKVDEELGLVRVSRFVGTYDAGNVINPRTARSQAIGGIIWGVGQALLEHSDWDPRTARYINRNYSGYLVPTNADIPYLDIAFAGSFDPDASLVGAKGLGELTGVSVAPAIANAVYHATGKRIRELPITVEKVI
jgi:xanthine dehydrogenase YagR molybdenum-binding subunit